MNPRTAREKAAFATAVKGLLEAAERVQRLWPEGWLASDLDLDGVLVRNHGLTPFGFDGLVDAIQAWHRIVTRDARAAAVSSAAWVLQQQTRADEAGIEFDPEGPPLALCEYCGSLYQYLEGPNSHTCPGVEAEGMASAREENR